MCGIADICVVKTYSQMELKMDLSCPPTNRYNASWQMANISSDLQF